MLYYTSNKTLSSSDQYGIYFPLSWRKFGSREERSDDALLVELIPDMVTKKFNNIRPYRLAVRTAPSHGANSGSSPDRVTSNNLNRTPQLEGGRFGLFHFLKQH